MAFSQGVLKRDVIGSDRVVYGDYTNNGGSTGGDCVTGLSVVKSFKIVPSGAAVKTDVSVPNETFPLINSNGAVTIVTTADEVGLWEAIGL